MREFEILDQQPSGVRVVSIRGELDLSHSVEARSALERAGSTPERPLVIDLTECDFLDSTGVSAIVAVSRTMRRAGTAIAIAASDGSEVRRILDLTGISQGIPTLGSLEEAVSAVSAPG